MLVPNLSNFSFCRTIQVLLMIDENRKNGKKHCFRKKSKHVSLIQIDCNHISPNIACLIDVTELSDIRQRNN